MKRDRKLSHNACVLWTGRESLRTRRAPRPANEALKIFSACGATTHGGARRYVRRILKTKLVTSLRVENT